LIGGRGRPDLWPTAAIVSLCLVTAAPLLGLVSARAAGVWVEDAFVASLATAPPPATVALTRTAAPTTARPSPTASLGAVPLAASPSVTPATSAAPSAGPTDTPAPTLAPAIQTSAVATRPPLPPVPALPTTPPPTPRGEWTFVVVPRGSGNVTLNTASGSASARAGQPLWLNYFLGQAPATLRMVNSEQGAATGRIEFIYLGGSARCTDDLAGSAVELSSLGSGGSGGWFAARPPSGAMRCDLSAFDTTGEHWMYVNFYGVGR